MAACFGARRVRHLGRSRRSSPTRCGSWPAGATAIRCCGCCAACRCRRTPACGRPRASSSATASIRWSCRSSSPDSRRSRRRWPARCDMSFGRVPRRGDRECGAVGRRRDGGRAGCSRRRSKRCSRGSAVTACSPASRSVALLARLRRVEGRAALAARAIRRGNEDRGRTSSRRRCRTTSRRSSSTSARGSRTSRGRTCPARCSSTSTQSASHDVPARPRDRLLLRVPERGVGEARHADAARARLRERAPADRRARSAGSRRASRSSRRCDERARRPKRRAALSFRSAARTRWSMRMRRMTPAARPASSTRAHEPGLVLGLARRGEAVLGEQLRDARSRSCLRGARA